MIEKTVRDYLLTQITNTSIGLEVPSPIPDTFLFIEKTGSASYDGITSATIAIQSYAPTLYESAQLNETVKAKMSAMLSQATISKVACNSDYNFTDPTNKRYRYQAVFEIVYNETA